MYGYKDIADNSNKGTYLRTAGIQMGGKFIGLEYVANENWEGFDIVLETADGKQFRERTFGPNIDKVYPKAKYEGGQKVGDETKQEAFDRIQGEISKKLFYLGSVFVAGDILRDKVKSVSDLKSLIDKTNAAIAMGDTDMAVNFLTMWKNSDTKQRSNLIIADRNIKWIEATRFNNENTMLPASISLTKYQVDNGMIEKYPYKGTNESTSSTSPVLNSGATDDLPF